MASAISVTQHALDRFMERAGITNPQTAFEILLLMVYRAEPIGGHRRWVDDWVIVVKRREVKTVFRGTRRLKKKRKTHLRKSLK